MNTKDLSSLPCPFSYITALCDIHVIETSDLFPLAGTCAPPHQHKSSPVHIDPGSEVISAKPQEDPKGFCSNKHSELMTLNTQHLL